MNPGLEGGQECRSLLSLPMFVENAPQPKCVVKSVVLDATVLAERRVAVLNELRVEEYAHAYDPFCHSISPPITVPLGTGTSAYTKCVTTLP